MNVRGVGRRPDAAAPGRFHRSSPWRNCSRRGRRRILAAVDLAAALGGDRAPRPGTYSFSFQESIVDARLAGPPCTGSFAAHPRLRPRPSPAGTAAVRTAAGGHTAGSFAMLDLVAPSPARFVQSSMVARYRGCGRRAARLLDGGVRAARHLGGARHPPVAAGARRLLGGGRGAPGPARIARPDRIRLKLGSTRSRRQPRRRHLRAVNQVSGTIEDATPPALTVTTAGAPTAAARTSRGRPPTGRPARAPSRVRVAGPGGFAVAPSGWEGAAAPNRACIAGQFITGCQHVGRPRRGRHAARRHRALRGHRDGDRRGRQRHRPHVAMARVAPPTVLAAPALTGVAQVGRTLDPRRRRLRQRADRDRVQLLAPAGRRSHPVRAAGADPSYTVVRADHGSRHRRP